MVEFQSASRATAQANATDIVAGIRGWMACLFVGGLLLVALIANYLAPTESSMGVAQRVLYIHVSVAWAALASFVALTFCGMLFLATRNLAWDRWSQAWGETGWLCASLTLVTGSLWAHAAWGTWWTWDPRLITSFVLWGLYSGNLILRQGIADRPLRARMTALLATFGLADVPLTVMATRWFRGIHPVAPTMETSMRIALWTCVAGLTAVLVLSVIRRKALLDLEYRLALHHMQLERM
jgi:heme exporter protein C